MTQGLAARRNSVLAAGPRGWTRAPAETNPRTPQVDKLCPAMPVPAKATQPVAGQMHQTLPPWLRNPDRQVRSPAVFPPKKNESPHEQKNESRSKSRHTWSSASENPGQTCIQGARLLMTKPRGFITCRNVLKAGTALPQPSQSRFISK